MRIYRTSSKPLMIGIDRSKYATVRTCATYCKDGILLFLLHSGDLVSIHHSNLEWVGWVDQIDEKKGILLSSGTAEVDDDCWIPWKDIKKISHLRKDTGIGGYICLK